jgi:PAS domain S-box-containing protein
MPEQITNNISTRDKMSYGLVAATVVAILFAARSYNYLLFHLLVELVTISFSFTIFLLVWNARTFIENNYIKVVGVGYSACAGIDFIHSLAFKGMNIFIGYDANLPTEMWIAARYLQALCLVAAPFAIRRKVTNEGLVAVFFLLSAMLMASIFNGIFPDCYREGIGLTPFKIGSEFVIVGLIILSIGLLRCKRDHFNSTTYKLLIASSVSAVCAELAFTAYIGVYDFANMVGHIFKIFSFYLVYRAIFVTGILIPYSLIFKEMLHKEKLLNEAYSSIQQQVQDQTKELHIILENAPIGISKIIDRKQVLVNKKTVDLFQYSKEEMENQTTRKLYPSDEAYEKLGRDAYPAIAQGHTFETVQELFRKDGARLLIRYVGQALDPADMSKGTIWLLEDITERKQAEVKLLESQQQLLMAQEIGKAGSWIYNLETNKIWGSTEGFRIYGFQPIDADFPTDDIEACIPERERVHQTLVNLISGKGKYDIEFDINPADGSPTKTVHSVARLEKDANGNPLKVIGFVQDITDRINVENSLRDSKLFMDSIIDQSPISMWVSDDKGTLLRANQSLRDLLKLTDEEIVGRYNLFDDPIVKDQGFMPLVRGVFEIGVPTRFTIIYDTSLATNLNLKNKSKSYLEVTISPVKNVEGKVTNAIIQHLDITELKHLENDLREAKRVAESANRAKSEFLANMSHEIRTPMNGLLGMAQLLEMSELTQEQTGYLAALKTSGKSLLTLINDILDLSKIEAGKITIEPLEFSLNSCINDVVLTQRSLIFQKGLKLELKLDSEIPLLLFGDQLRVRQILLNLLSNAIKFTANGTISISADILEKNDNSVRVQLAISDSGIGISPEAIEKIFNPFEQEDGSTTRRYGGTGLGLTISRRLTEIMGGEITVESRQEVGSCFKVILPFTVVRNSRLEEMLFQKADYRWEGIPLSILYVEDDEVNILLGTSILKKLGHEVTVAENGRECLEALEQGKFDIILMDVQMPVMNGEEALLEIRRQENDTHLHQPVIAMTAHSLRGEKEHFLDNGFDGYVSKPLGIGELIDEMKRVLG